MTDTQAAAADFGENLGFEVFPTGGCCQLSSHSVRDRWQLDLSFYFSLFITSHSLPLHVVTTVMYWGLGLAEGYGIFVSI